MWEFYISICAFRQVQDFVTLASAQPFDIIAGNEYQTINGKDLMGMFSLDYTRPLSVKMHCSEEEYLRFKEQVENILA